MVGPSTRCPWPWTRLSIDYTLCRGSTLYPHHGTHGLAFPFGWTNGIPTKPLHCHSTLPATPTQIPNGLVLGGPVSTKDTPTTVVVKTLPLGDTPTRGLGTIISSTSTQDYVCLPGQGKHDIIFPRWRHRPEAVSMDRIKAFPQGKCGCTGKKLDSAAPWPSQRYIQVELYSGSTLN